MMKEKQKRRMTGIEFLLGADGCKFWKNVGKGSETLYLKGFLISGIRKSIRKTTFSPDFSHYTLTGITGNFEIKIKPTLWQLNTEISKLEIKSIRHP